MGNLSLKLRCDGRNNLFGLLKPAFGNSTLPSAPKFVPITPNTLPYSPPFTECFQNILFHMVSALPVRPSLNEYNLPSFVDYFRWDMPIYLIDPRINIICETDLPNIPIAVLHRVSYGLIIH